MEYKFRTYSKEYGMSDPCSIFDIQIMDCEGLTDMSEVEIMQFTGLYDCTKWEELTEAEKMEFYGLNKLEEGVPLRKCRTFEEVEYLWQGKEIYEGDILKLWRSVGFKGDLRGEYYKPLEVKYCDLWCQFVVENRETKEQYGIYQCFEVFKIVGNVHDNVELLEAKNG